MSRIFPLLTLLCGIPGAAFCQDPAPAPILPQHLHWVSVPNMPALQIAWVLGSELAPGAYVLRTRLAANARIPPHAHPDTRNSTVLSGTLYVGFGEVFDESKLVAVPGGGVYVAPANVMHYLWAKDGDIEYQEAGVGPTGTLLTATTLPPEHTEESSLVALSWLAGCWGNESAEPGTGEQWLLPAGGSMLGAGRTVRDAKTVDFEFMRIHTTTEGKIVFTALPYRQQEASFEMLSLSADEVTFENMQHDFPQRVSYSKVSDDRISARIEGSRDGEMRGIDFPLRRVPCESPVDATP